MGDIKPLNKVTATKIESLVPDNLNFNKGTQFGQHLIENSLRQLGAGRSILLDKNNRIIAGNKTFENAGAIGMSDIIIVETTGTQLVAVKRMDIDLDSKIGREMALADNASSKANLDWDEQNIIFAQAQWGVDPADWGIVDFAAPEPEKPEGPKAISTKLFVECADLASLENLFEELQNRGFKVTLKE